MLLIVDLLQVAHQGYESRLVRFEGVARTGRKNVDRFAIGPDSVRKTFGIFLHPRRNIVHVAVFPGSEPQQHQMQVVCARALHDLVHNAEVKMALLGLKLLPVDRRGHGVGVQSGHRLPHLREFAEPCAGVVNLAAQYQVRTAFNKQGVAAVFLHEPRRFYGQSQRKRNESKERSGKETAKSGVSHEIDYPLKNVIVARGLRKPVRHASILRIHSPSSAATLRGCS